MFWFEGLDRSGPWHRPNRAKAGLSQRAQWRSESSEAVSFRRGLAWSAKRPPGLMSTTTVSPRAISPHSRCSESWSSIRLVITRRSDTILMPFRSGLIQQEWSLPRAVIGDLDRDWLSLTLRPNAAAMLFPLRRLGVGCQCHFDEDRLLDYWIGLEGLFTRLREKHAADRVATRTSYHLLGLDLTSSGACAGISTLHAWPVTKSSTWCEIRRSDRDRRHQRHPIAAGRLCPDIASEERRGDSDRQSTGRLDATGSAAESVTTPRETARLPVS